MYLAPRSSPRLEMHGTSGFSTLAYRSLAVGELTPTDLDRLAQAARDRNRAESVSAMTIFDGEQFLQWLEGPDDALARIWTSIQRDARHTSIELLGRSPTAARFFGDFDLRLSKRGAPRQGSRREEISPANELARLAIDAGPERRAALDATLGIGECASAQSKVVMIEMAARRLGDLWQADACGDFDVTLGLGRLQGCVRRCNESSIDRVVLDGSPRVLVAPVPGEPHLLGAALDGDAMWRAGWHPQIEFPVDEEALCRLLASRSFDVLDLSLSPAFRREHWLPRLKAMIRGARSLSRNPGLAVVVGGRVFGERPRLAAAVGADEAIDSSSTVESSIVGTLLKRESAIAWA